VCCSVLQYSAECCSVLQCVAMCCSVSSSDTAGGVGTPMSVMSRTNCVVVSCRVLQCVVVCCSILQCVAV